MAAARARRRDPHRCRDRRPAPAVQRAIPQHPPGEAGWPLTAARAAPAGQDHRTGGWVSFMHPPRDYFMAAMSDAGRAASGEHAAWLRQLPAGGVLIAGGPCPGRVSTGHRGLRGTRPGEGTAHRGR